MVQNQPTNVLKVEDAGGPIPFELAAKMVKDYNDLHSHETPTHFTIGRKIIEKALAQPGCVGIRFYNALNEEGSPTLVYVGVDSNAKAILKYSVIATDGELKQVDGLILDRTLGPQKPPSDGLSWDWTD